MTFKRIVSGHYSLRFLHSHLYLSYPFPLSNNLTMATSSLLQTALQNLHVSQQIHQQSHTPHPPSSPGSTSSRLSSAGGTPPVSDWETDDDEIITVGKGTRPATPVFKLSSVLGEKSRDPVSSVARQRVDEADRLIKLRTLPTHLAVRIFLMLDIRSLARSDRVCKRWHKSSTLNYGELLERSCLIYYSAKWPQ